MNYLNLNKIHTTELGILRIKKNLELETKDVVKWCKNKTKNSVKIIKKGENWYINIENIIFTVGNL